MMMYPSSTTVLFSPSFFIARHAGSVGPTGLINYSGGEETGRGQGRALLSPWRYRRRSRKRNILFFLFFSFSKYPSGRSDKKGAEMYCDQEEKKGKPPHILRSEGEKAFSFPLCNCRMQLTTISTLDFQHFL